MEIVQLEIAIENLNFPIRMGDEIDVLKLVKSGIVEKIEFL
ncbi:MAG: hypothetical protein PF569_09405 [Candidatus Woesearchaeota archaeon]|jgi:hypothetical protein|nr:hypothetical protein [Candidatus Woesearchaeota archaeon]